MKKIKFFKNLSSKEALIAALFLLPAVSGCVIFIFLPSICSFLLSFFKWNLITPVKFAGLNNYIELFQSDSFWFILKNTIYYALMTAVFASIIPLILAAILHSRIRGSEFYKTAYFLPFITPMTASAMIWQWIFDPNTGLVNALFKIHQEWLYNSETVLNVLIFITVWKLTGYNMIIYLSGFAGLNPNVYEAAKIDGAGSLKAFLRITLPLMSPSIFFVLLITIVSSFQVFDLIYLMMQGGADNAANILVYWLYKNAFEYFDIGRASAIAYVLFVLILIFTIIQWKIRKKWVITEQD